MSASRAKGTTAETAVVRYLRDNGFPHAERRALGGTNDRGDIAGVIGTVIEVKACARTELGEWVKEANREAANDNATYGVVWHKRRGYSNPAGWFVTMDGWTFVQLLRAAQGLGEPRDVLTLLDELHRAMGAREPAGPLAARLAANETTVLDELEAAQQRTLSRAGDLSERLRIADTQREAFAPVRAWMDAIKNGQTATEEADRHG